MRPKGSKNKKKMDAKRVLFYAQEIDVDLLENLGDGNKSLGLRRVIQIYNILMTNFTSSCKENDLAWKQISKILTIEIK